MARKKLSDLLREEAQKPVEGGLGEVEAVPEKATPSAQGRSPRTQPKSTRAASSKSSSASSRAKPSTSAPRAAAKTQAQAPAQTEAQPVESSDDAAALSQQISELQAALTAAQRREDLLKRQVLELETTVEAEKERSQQLQQELDQAKLQNRPLVSLPDHPAAGVSPKGLAPKQFQPVSVLEAELEKIFRQPVSTDAPYKELTSEDIGWMD